MAITPLVTLEYVKSALHIIERDGNGVVLDHEDDGLIQGYMKSVTEAVLRYLRALETSTWTETTAPEAVKLAIVIGVKSLYDPEAQELLSGLAASDPKNPIVGLLCMMRKPTLA
ncbi:head-tail connector protein [Mesorhizobium amorphae]|uniref:head-tail connector protein n=1 Tax=Mesorhizobium amorphae TaxID=71433 RepID=UPI0011827043|nr:head-tail connector protein [Mesorhizobium amorphae]